MSNKQTAVLWIFPEQDFDLWKRECRGPDDTYEEYCAWIDTMRVQLQDQGHDVIFSRISVAQMLHELEVRNLENTPQNRSFITANIGRNEFGT